jgi:hypothetical protein
MLLFKHLRSVRWNNDALNDDFHYLLVDKGHLLKIVAIIALKVIS